MTVALVLILIVLAVAVILSTQGAGAGETARQERLGEGGLKPDYLFKGRCYHSLKSLSRNDDGRRGGLKFMLALYRDQQFVRVFFWQGREQGSDLDVRFDEIDDIQIVRDKMFIACAIATHNQNLIGLELQTLFVTAKDAKEVYELYDHLLGAVKGKGVRRDRQYATASLPILRRAARLSRRQFARELGVELGVLKELEAGTILLTPEIAKAARAVLLGRGVSDVSASLLDWGEVATEPTIHSSSSDIQLTTVERLLSEISGKLSTLVSGNPGHDLKAVINRLETANDHLKQISNNTGR